MKTTYDYYSDAGHGWLKVPLKELEVLKISNNISSYSYVRGDYAYLEEDSDASIFLNAYKEETNNTPKIKSHTTDKRSKIRGYNSYGRNY